MAIPRTKSFSGPAIFSYGFRPFFFLGTIYSGVAIILWVPMFYGWLDIQTAFAPLDWHIHEMLFGFLPAIITGFLLTAVPNWTGRLPLQGIPLAVLVALWVAGRLAVLFSATLGAMPTAVIDNLFLAAVALAVGNEIVAGKNWRNLKVLVPLIVLFVANVLFHAEAYLSGGSDYSRRLGTAAVITLIMSIGGRVIPSFTRNWLVRAKPGRLPVPFNRFDRLALMFGVAGFSVWILRPDSSLAGVILLVAGLLHYGRLARWAGDRTWREPLVIILHIGYLFVPTGFVLTGLAALYPELITPAAGYHAFGAGAVGTMTLAVMMRATLGHTGRALAMSKSAIAVFVLVFLAALSRIVASFDTSFAQYLIEFSGVAWAAGFLGFATVFGPALLQRKRRPGD